MKKIALFLQLTFVFLLSAKAQTFFETGWTSNGVKYTGLLIYYDDNDATMRIKYQIDGKYKVAEFDCYGEYLESGTYAGYLLDGRDAKIVYGDNGTGYSADNFIFMDENGTYATPIHIDDQGLENNEIQNHMTEVDYWTQITTDKLTETYVYSFFDKTDPLYKTLLSYNLQYTQDNASNSGYKISSLASTGETWALTMSKGTGYTNQTWKTSYEYPQDWVKEKWGESLYITSVAYAKGTWAVVMNKGTTYTAQSWTTSSDFPEDWVNEKWAEGFYITSTTYGNGAWAVVMSKGTGYTDQLWSTSSTFPDDWVNEKWDEDLYISSLAYGNGSWVVIMTEGNGYTAQSWNTSFTYPQDWIREKWAEGFEITSMANGNGIWEVTMSKGTGYLYQSWKTSTSFPKDWIQEKWKGESVQAYNEPEITENSKLHLILVTNTLISDIGPSCKIDKNNVTSELETIADELEIPVVKTVIDDRKFSKKSVEEALNGLSPGANDIVFFVYSGHGYRWSNQTSNYPNLDLRYSNYETISEGTSYNLYSIYSTIIAKGARLNVIIGDCCNSDIGISNRGGEPSLTTRKMAQGKVDKLKALFLHSKGNLVAAAARPNETSCGNSIDGGYFLSSFFSALSRETSQLNDETPNWNSIISRAISAANYKTQNLSGCDQQNGIYYSTVK